MTSTLTSDLSALPGTQQPVLRLHGPVVHAERREVQVEAHRGEITLPSFGDLQRAALVGVDNLRPVEELPAGDVAVEVAVGRKHVVEVVAELRERVLDQRVDTGLARVGGLEDLRRAEVRAGGIGRRRETGRRQDERETEQNEAFAWLGGFPSVGELSGGKNPKEVRD